VTPFGYLPGVAVHHFSAPLPVLVALKPKGEIMRSINLSFIFFTIFVGGCVNTGGMPTPAVSKYVITEGAGFGRVNGEWSYGISYTLKHPFTNQVSGVVRFQNPADLTQWLEEEIAIEAGQRQVTVNSPALACLDNGKTYNIELTIEDGGNVIAVHKDKSLFRMEGELLQLYGPMPCV
jgi:hypothetical protein